MVFLSWLVGRTQVFFESGHVHDRGFRRFSIVGFYIWSDNACAKN